MRSRTLVGLLASVFIVACQQSAPATTTSPPATTAPKPARITGSGKACRIARRKSGGIARRIARRQSGLRGSCDRRE